MTLTVYLGGLFSSDSLFSKQSPFNHPRRMEFLGRKSLKKMLERELQLGRLYYLSIRCCRMEEQQSRFLALLDNFLNRTKEDRTTLEHCHKI